MRYQLHNLASTERPVWIVLHTGHPLDWLERHGKLSNLRVVARFESGPHTVVAFKKISEKDD